MRKHPALWCCRCGGRIYSSLTSLKTDRGPVCLVCQRRALQGVPAELLPRGPG